MRLPLLNWGGSAFKGLNKMYGLSGEAPLKVEAPYVAKNWRYASGRRTPISSSRAAISASDMGVSLLSPTPLMPPSRVNNTCVSTDHSFLVTDSGGLSHHPGA